MATTFPVMFRHYVNLATIWPPICNVEMKWNTSSIDKKDLGVKLDAKLIFDNILAGKSE